MVTLCFENFILIGKKKKNEQDPDKEIETKPGLLLAGLCLGAWYYPMCCKCLTNASLLLLLLLSRFSRVGICATP